MHNPDSRKRRLYYAAACSPVWHQRYQYRNTFSAAVIFVNQPGYRPPIAQQALFGIERELGRGLSISLSSNLFPHAETTSRDRYQSAAGAVQHSEAGDSRSLFIATGIRVPRRIRWAAPEGLPYPEFRHALLCESAGDTE